MKGSLYSYLIVVLLVLGSTNLFFLSTADHHDSTPYEENNECHFHGLRAHWQSSFFVKHLKRMKKDVAHDKNKKTLIVITPTYVHANQYSHFRELERTLVTLPYDVVWIVVEAGGLTNETSKLKFKTSRQLLNIKHIGFDYKIPSPFSSEARKKMESQMRLQALRVVKGEKLDGIVIFADESDYHDRTFFDEIQKVKWIGSVPIIFHRDDDNKQIIQGPACNSSYQITDWLKLASNMTSNMEIVLPEKLPWSGFVMSSRLIWEEAKFRPEWIKDLDIVMAANRGGDENPLSFVKDLSMVEPLGGCGKQWLVYWHRDINGSTRPYCRPKDHSDLNIELINKSAVRVS